MSRRTVSPYHCNCRIRADESYNVGKKCPDCRTVIKPGLPIFREMEKRHKEQQEMDARGW